MGVNAWIAERQWLLAFSLQWHAPEAILEGSFARRRFHPLRVQRRRNSRSGEARLTGRIPRLRTPTESGRKVVPIGSEFRMGITSAESQIPGQIGG